MRKGGILDTYLACSGCGSMPCRCSSSAGAEILRGVNGAIRDAIKTALDSADLCDVCGSPDDDDHMSRPHMFEPIDVAQALVDELGKAGFEIRKIGEDALIASGVGPHEEQNDEELARMDGPKANSTDVATASEAVRDTSTEVAACRER